MPNKLPGVVSEFVAACYRNGITDSREIIDLIQGQYVADESCTEKYKDRLAAATIENSE